MVERRSLSYLVLMAAITLVVGALLYQALDPVASGIMDREGYRANNGTGFESPVGPSIGLTQGWVRRLWTLAPLLLIIAVTTSLVIAGRRGRGRP